MFTYPKKKSSKVLELNTFSGVFIPTFLSIIGVILYLRLGYIIGNVGIWYTLLIIILAVSVTLATGLSLSSITTNIKIGAGGPYSIISKTLGLEVGGSVGIPLYLAQVFSVALYIFGFSEVWTFAFPNHPLKLVALVMFIFLFLSVALSTKLAIKLQSIVFIIVITSLISIFLGGHWWHVDTIVTAPIDIDKTSFWQLFAIFFPAVTGLMAGIGMSGELKDPKKQIPLGILTALTTTTFIYIATALWLALVASHEELLSNTMIMTDKALFGPLVVLGMGAATFSSALITFLAAPRLLRAMSNNRVVPFSLFFLKLNKNKSPHNAIIFSSIIIFFLLLLGNLNSIATTLTMFFLITYIMINLVVFVEQTLGSVSFRPTMKIPKIVPLYGALTSLLFMFLINVFVGIAALLTLILIYILLVQKNLKTDEGDVRSGLLIVAVEWAAKRVGDLPENKAHTWKPNVLLPVVTTRTLLGNFPLIRALTFPNGTMTVLGLKLTKDVATPEKLNMTKAEASKGLSDLPELVDKFSQEHIFTSSSTVEVKDYTNGICISLEAIGGQVFHPNILFLPFKPNQLKETELERIFLTAQRSQTGVVLFDKDETVGLGSHEDIHVWISDKALKNDLYDNHKMFDLAMILSYRLYNNWHGQINIWMCTSEKNKRKARYYIEKLLYESRFPQDTQIHISTNPFLKTLENAPNGDIHIIPTRQNPNIRHLKQISNRPNKSFIFISDSNQEDVLA